MNRFCERVQVPVTPEMLARLREQAKREGRSMASLARFAFSAYLKEAKPDHQEESNGT